MLFLVNNCQKYILATYCTNPEHMGPDTCSFKITFIQIIAVFFPAEGAVFKIVQFGTFKLVTFRKK